MKPPVLVIAAVAFLVSPHLCAQGRFLVGVTAGASSTSLSGNTPENGSYTSKLGFSAGLMGEYALTDDIHLSVQPSYVRRGTGVAFDVGTADMRDSLGLTLDYLSIPVLARFLTPGGTLFINGGLDLSVLLHASLTDVNAGGSVDVQNLINDLDLLMILGVGWDVHWGPALLSIELRYGQSLFNAGANDQLAASAGISPRFRSSGFQLLAAVLFSL